MAFIRINRKLFEHFLWKENRVYSKAEAWIDLIQLMSYSKNPKDREKIINGVLVKWDRGQYPVSYSFLAQRWNWSVHKVRIFMNLLKNEKQVTTKTASVTTILTLCKYDTYNPISQAEEQAEGRSDGNRTAISKESKEVEEVFLKENYIKEKNQEEEPEDFSFLDIPENKEIIPEGF